MHPPSQSHTSLPNCTQCPAVAPHPPFSFHNSAHRLQSQLNAYCSRPPNCCFKLVCSQSASKQLVSKQLVPKQLASKQFYVPFGNTSLRNGHNNRRVVRWFSRRQRTLSHTTVKLIFGGSVVGLCGHRDSQCFHCALTSKQG